MNDTNVGMHDLPYPPVPRILVAGPKSSRTGKVIDCLKRLSYSVGPLAETSESAMSQTQSHPPQLALVDIHINGHKTAFETADDIRLQYDVPVLFLCDGNEAGGIPEISLSMPFGYLEMPFADRDVYRMVEAAFHADRLEKRLRIAEQARYQAEAGYDLLANNGNDITEHKKIITRLLESEEKFKALAEACPFAIMMYQNDYWVYVNPAAEYISGYSREELYHMPFWVIVHPDFQPLVRQRGQQRQAGQQAPPAYDFKIVNKAGKDIWVSLSGGVLMYEGQPAGLITVIDINERKQAEASLRESEERYRTILEGIEDGYYEVDLSGNFIFFNDPVCRISGYGPDEIIGVHYRQYADKENAVKLRVIFSTVFKTRTPARTCDLQVISKDGSHRHLEISVSLILDASGQPLGFRGIIRDITERKLAEEQKAKLEAQLQHAQKMEAIGTLAGGIAHDFNNILQGINGYTQLLLLKKPEQDPDCQKLIQIQQAVDRAARLIDQLLTFSRKMEGHRCSLSLNHEIRQVEQILKQTVPKMIHIDLHLENDLRPVNADPIQIEQILLNLGSNAADAMPDGGRLTIETGNAILDKAFCKNHLGADPGEYVMLTVSDTGCGMEPCTVAHIFDPFFTTKGIGKGTGLGLASVYGIVKSHGGYITCYTELGQGTVFKIYLPAISQPVNSLEPVLPETRLPGGSETILVVDDELPIREAATEMLSHFGYAVINAENGEKALTIYREWSRDIDLVIMDLSMPGMGGYQCLNGMLMVNPCAKILISSGYATQGNARDAMQHGAAGFIGKPYQLSDFITRVRAVLDCG